MGDTKTTPPSSHFVAVLSLRQQYCGRQFSRSHIHSVYVGHAIKLFAPAVGCLGKESTIDDHGVHELELG